LKKSDSIIERTFIHEYGDQCTFLGVMSKRTISDENYSQPENRKVCDLELIIERVVGIKQGAADLTPMDYRECKSCMQELLKKQTPT
jgi:hypothetical protein